MKKIFTLLTICFAATLFGCAAVKLNSNAQKVLVSPNKPAKGCKYLGQATGSQGNTFTGDLTSNKNLDAGSMNDVRNQAANMSGNYVQILTNRASIAGGGGGYDGTGGGGISQSTATVIGNVYKCPNQ